MVFFKKQNFEKRFCSVFGKLFSLFVSLFSKIEKGLKDNFAFSYCDFFFFKISYLNLTSVISTKQTGAAEYIMG